MLGCVTVSALTMQKLLSLPSMHGTLHISARVRTWHHGPGKDLGRDWSTFCTPHQWQSICEGTQGGPESTPNSKPGQSQRHEGLCPQCPHCARCLASFPGPCSCHLLSHHVCPRSCASVRGSTEVPRTLPMATQARMTYGTGRCTADFGRGSGHTRS